MSESEDLKLTFRDGDEVRVLRGQIISSDDPFFITIKRRDGIIKIAKSAVIKIDMRHIVSNGGGDGC